jgi:hypothetical protein
MEARRQPISRRLGAQAFKTDATGAATFATHHDCLQYFSHVEVPLP